MPQFTHIYSTPSIYQEALNTEGVLQTLFLSHETDKPMGKTEMGQALKFSECYRRESKGSY